MDIAGGSVHVCVAEEGLHHRKIDTGFGQESKPKKLYQVTGVPNNYLIDCSTGKVIAVNLRGEALDEKLQELF